MVTSSHKISYNPSPISRLFSLGAPHDLIVFIYRGFINFFCIQVSRQSRQVIWQFLPIVAVQFFPKVAGEICLSRMGKNPCRPPLNEIPVIRSSEFGQIH